MSGEFPEFREVLDEKLHGLLATASLSEGNDASEISELLAGMEEWLGAAQHLLPGEIPAFSVVVRQLRQGLGRGRALEKVHHRILKTLAEIQARLRRLDDPAWAGVKPEAALDIKRKEEQILPTAPPSAVSPVRERRLREIGSDEKIGFEDLLQEAPDHLRRLEGVLAVWDRGDEADALEGYRAFHTLKGIFGFLEMPDCASLAHQAEEWLEPFKKEGKPGTSSIETLWAVSDYFGRQLGKIREGLPKGAIELLDSSELIKRLECGVATKVPSQDEENMTPRETRIPNGPLEDPDHLRVPVERVETLLEEVGDLLRLHSEISSWVSPESPESGGLERLGRSLLRIQERVLHFRLIPVKNLLLRMERTARELSRRMSKPIRVRLEGLDTEFDKHLVEELQEPLLHLVRNAVDHGLEDTENRRHKGKTEEGCLTIRAFSQGGGVTLEVEDDGRGIDVEALTAKARALGWWKTSETAPRETALRWIFKPGFSTAKTLTEVSGRGVGLDVVARKVLELKGSLRVETALGGGSRFILRVPLTLALVDAVLLRLGRHRFALPSAQVVGFSEAECVTNRNLGDRLEWVEKGSETMMRLDLAGLLGIPAPRMVGGVAVEIEFQGGRASILADEILGRHRLLLRNLRGVVHHMPGLSGGVLLPDGTVGFLLDPDRLMA
jgi:two-component system chemotaxis sensor kinase CheA